MLIALDTRVESAPVAVYVDNETGKGRASEKLLPSPSLDVILNERLHYLTLQNQQESQTDLIQEEKQLKSQYQQILQAVQSASSELEVLVDICSQLLPRAAPPPVLMPAGAVSSVTPAPQVAQPMPPVLVCKMASPSNISFATRLADKSLIYTAKAKFTSDIAEWLKEQAKQLYHQMELSERILNQLAWPLRAKSQWLISYAPRGFEGALLIDIDLGLFSFVEDSIIRCQAVSLDEQQIAFQWTVPAKWTTPWWAQITYQNENHNLYLQQTDMNHVQNVALLHDWLLQTRWNYIQRKALEHARTEAQGQSQFIVDLNSIKSKHFEIEFDYDEPPLTDSIGQSGWSKVLPILITRSFLENHFNEKSPILPKIMDCLEHDAALKKFMPLFIAWQRQNRNIKVNRQPRRFSHETSWLLSLYEKSFLLTLKGNKLQMNNYEISIFNSDWVSLLSEIVK